MHDRWHLVADKEVKRKKLKRLQGQAENVATAKQKLPEGRECLCMQEKG